MQIVTYIFSNYKQNQNICHKEGGDNIKRYVELSFLYVSYWHCPNLLYNSTKYSCYSPDQKNVDACSLTATPDNCQTNNQSFPM